jgi:hypothetical protein
MLAGKERRVAIVQSNYIPWKGYFDLIRLVDEFILFDTAQYTRRDWRNRNLIKTSQGTAWLTIPVQVKGRYLQTIRETRVRDQEWREQHWKTLRQNYARAPHFAEHAARFEKLYLEGQEEYLSEINHRFIREICDILDIKTMIRWSSDYPEIEGNTERLVEWCKVSGATEYLSGPAAKDYIVEERFAAAGIKLLWMDYSGYPEYRQPYPPFEHGVSVLDLIFNEGPDANRYMKARQ